MIQIEKKILKFRIKLQTFNYKKLIQISNRITSQLINNFNINVQQISLPTKKRIYCLLCSPHIDKDAREHIEIRIYKKIIEFYKSRYINIKIFIPSSIKIKIFQLTI